MRQHMPNIPLIAVVLFIKRFCRCRILIEAESSDVCSCDACVASSRMGDAGVAAQDRQSPHIVA